MKRWQLFTFGGYSFSLDNYKVVDLSLPKIIIITLESNLSDNMC